MEHRPGVGVLNQYGDQVGPQMLDQEGNPIIVTLQHPAHPIPEADQEVAQQDEHIPAQEVNIIDLDLGAGPSVGVSARAGPPGRAPSLSGGLPNLRHLNLEPLDPNTNLDNINIDLSGWEFGPDELYAVHPQPSASNPNA